MQSVNNEKYRIEKRICNNDSNELKGKFQVTRKRERIKLTQKYKILSALDPNTGIKYDLDEIIELNLIDKNTSFYQILSTGELVEIDQAINLGYVQADLVEESLETSNELIEYTEQIDNIFKDESIQKLDSPKAISSGNKVEIRKCLNKR